MGQGKAEAREGRDVREKRELENIHTSSHILGSDGDPARCAARRGSPLSRHVDCEVL
jgi:hypothetical protein